MAALEGQDARGILAKGVKEGRTGRGPELRWSSTQCMRLLAHLPVTCYSETKGAHETIHAPADRGS